MSAKELMRLAVIYSLVAFWTTVSMLRALFQFARNPRTFFHVKQRSLPPIVLQDGWNHAIVALSEVKLHYVHLGENGKPLMLFVHGFPEFWYSWRHQLRRFQNDYKVVAIDMRGYGGSDKPGPKSAYTVSKLSNDIKELVTALGYKSCVLVAHDWGGVIAWRCAVKYPEVIERLIVMNAPNSDVFLPYIAKHPIQLLRSWYIFFFQCPYVPELVFRSRDLNAIEQMFTKAPVGCKNPNAFSAEDIEAFKFVFSQPNALTSPINYYRNILSNSKENKAAEGRSKTVTVPTLLIWGTEDAALEKNLAEASIALCENGTLRYVEGASHWVQQDQPEKVNELMQEFLAT